MSEHKIESEGIDYDVDQPMGWGIVCSCGWKDTLTNPDAAHAAFERHVDEEADTPYPSTHKMTLEDEGEMRC